MDIDHVEYLVENMKTQELILYLEQFNRKSRQTPKKNHKTLVLHKIRESIDSESIMNVADCMYEMDTPTSLELAARLYAETYTVDKMKVNDRLLYIADHYNWEVREWAAGACGFILENNFTEYIEIIKFKWVNSDSENIRRAVVVALKYISKSREPSYEKQIFKIIDMMTADTSAYVQKNLGPFAIGDGLLKYYPESTVHMINIWKNSNNPQVRWNVVKIFSSAEGEKHKKLGISILKSSLDDEDFKVRNAAKSILKKWKKRGIYE